MHVPQDSFGLEGTQVPVEASGGLVGVGLLGEELMQLGFEVFLVDFLFVEV